MQIMNFLDILQQNQPTTEIGKEMDMYEKGKRSYEKSLKEKGGLEYYLISKKFIKQWKNYVDYYDEMPNESPDQREKPHKINADLINEDKSLFKYFPDDHSYNITMRFLENEWDYDFLLKDTYQQFASKYSSVSPIVRIGLYDENYRRKMINPNLARLTLIYQSPINNKIITQKIQVDYNSEIKSWTNLIKESIEYQCKSNNIKNVRLWQPKHKKFRSELLIQQLEKTKQIDGEIINEYNFVYQLKLSRDDCLILDIEQQNWQFSKNSDQNFDLEILYDRAINGCNKYICNFDYCKRNNNFLSMDLSLEDIKGICQQLIENEEVNFDQLCYSVEQQIQPFYKDLQYNSALKQLQLISKNIDIFGASFVENYNKNSPPYNINQENPELDFELLRNIQDLLPKSEKSQLNGIEQPGLLEIHLWINHLFSEKEKNIEKLTNPLQLRALFIILCLNKYFKSILEKQFKEKNYPLMKIIKRLDKKQQLQISKWFTYLSKNELEDMIKTCKKEIQSQILQLQKSRLVFQEIDDAQKLQCIFELQNLLYKSNQIKKRVSNQEFIIENVAKVYQYNADKEEFTQFRQYSLKVWRDYSFTFCQYPWAIPIEFKNKLLSLDCRVKQQDAVRSSYRFMYMDQIPYLSLSVDRSNIIESTIKEMTQYHGSYKSPLKVQFIGEQGVDEGGPKREFFRLLMEKLVNQHYGMFIYKNNDTVFWFNPKSFEMPIYYELIGKLLGLALYNQVLLNIQFPTVLFKKLQDEKVTEEDLKELDMEIYQGFCSLRDYKDPNIEDTFALCFQVTYSVWGEVYYEDLKPDGFKIPVTQENKEEYIQLYTEWYLNKSVEKQFSLLKQGFKKVVDGEGIKLFNGEELQCLIIGLPDFDIKDLEAVTHYDGYEKDCEYIKYFWTCIQELDTEMQKRFLFFCTGTDRIPVGGLKSIKFVIQKHGEDTDQLPSAHTCFNVLLLPLYKKKETIKEKLMISLENAEGFGLM